MQTKVRLTPSAFLNWLDSDSMVLEATNGTRIVRAYNQKLGKIQLFFAETNNFMSTSLNTALLIKLQNSYLVVVANNHTNVSWLPIFSDRVVLMDISSTYDKMAVKIYANVLRSLCDGPKKIVSDGLLNELSISLTSVLNPTAKPGDSFIYDDIFANPSLIPSFTGEQADFETFLSAYAEHQPNRFHPCEISDTILFLSYTKKDEYVTNLDISHHADAILQDILQNRFDKLKDIDYLLKLNVAIAHLRRFCPDYHDQTEIIAYGEKVKDSVATTKSKMLTLFFPKTNKPLKQCTPGDLDSVNMPSFVISRSTANRTLIGVKLSKYFNDNSFGQNHPLSWTQDGLIPWTKFHHIVTDGETVWENPLCFQ